MSARARVGLCTDSTAQLPPEIVDRFDVAVVPVTVTVDGEEYLEGIDLDVDGVPLERLLAGQGDGQGPPQFACRDDDVDDDVTGHLADLGRTASARPGSGRPAVSISQPSPGQYALAFEDLLARGVTEILSLHGPGIAGSGTCSSARLAAHRLAAPVRVVDTGASGVALGCCVWAAGEAIARGATIDEAAAIALSVGEHVEVRLVLDALGPAAGAVRGPGDPAGPIVYAERDGELVAVDRVDSVSGAVDSIAAEVVGLGTDLLVGIGHAGPAVGVVADALAAAVGETAAVREVVRFRVSPSAAAAIGPDALVCVAFPAAAAQRALSRS